MIKLLPIVSFLLAISAFYLKNLYGTIHWTLSRLLSVQDINSPSPMISTLESVNSKLFLLAIFYGLIATMISVIVIREKLCNRILGLVVLIVAVISVIASLIPT